MYETLPDAASAQSAYGSLLSGVGVAAGSGGCWDGLPGEIDYTYGRAACWTDPKTGSQNVTWTFEPANVVATATGTKNLDALVSWWWFHALLKPLSSGAGLTPDEQFLLEKAPADIQVTCEHYDPLSDASAYKPVGSLGSIDCYPKGVHVQDVGWYRFTTPAALDDWYDYRLGEAKLRPDSGGCFDATAGETTWAHGRIACFVSSTHQAKIRWTDDRYLSYGAANATNKDLPALVAWWQAADLP